MSPQDQLHVVADAAPSTSETTQPSVERHKTRSDGADDPNTTAQKETADPRRAPSRSDSAERMTRYFTFTVAAALIAGLIIAVIRAHRATRK